MFFRQKNQHLAMMEEKCDLSPFFCEKSMPEKTKESEIHHASTNLDQNYKETLQQQQPGTPLSTAILYTWHKLLSILGGSQITRLCVINEELSLAGIQIFDHKPHPIDEALSSLLEENLLQKFCSSGEILRLRMMSERKLGKMRMI